MTRSSAHFAEPPEHQAPTVEELFADSDVVEAANDLARLGLFEDDELDDFLDDLSAMRHADLA